MFVKPWATRRSFVGNIPNRITGGRSVHQDNQGDAMTKVPYRKLTKDEMSFCKTVLRPCSRRLKYWATFLGKRKAREFRKLIFKGIKEATARSASEAVIPPARLQEFRTDRDFIVAVH